MRTDVIDYSLPEELIAQSPCDPRDASRLLLCPKTEGPFRSCLFRDLPELLKPGDTLVVNAARVMPARLIGYKHPGGARIEVLLLERVATNDSGLRFRALLKRRRRLQPGDMILFPQSRMVATVVESPEEVGEDIVELGGIESAAELDRELERIGQIPLPPYIKSYSGDMERYQTVYARIGGSVAAPTAGLHFTPGLLAALERKGIERVEAHLRVGWGTFSPIRSEDLEEHRLHEEDAELGAQEAEIVNQRRRAGGRTIAVGTTMTRLLESAADDEGRVRAFQGSTGLYITPGYRFRAIDGLVTNFHLPRTSLLALVAAFMGVERTLEAYRLAIEERYRFYSFGDAMLIV